MVFSFSNFFIESLRIIYERHKYSALWLTEYRNAEKSRDFYGLMVRCVDPRIHLVMSTDSLSRLVGKIAEIRSFGGLFDLDYPPNVAIVKKLEESIRHLVYNGHIDAGILYVEGHSDCAFIRGYFEGKLDIRNSHVAKTMNFLDHLISAIKIRGTFEEIMEKFEPFGSHARLHASADLREMFNHEKIRDPELRNLIKKTPSPYYSYLKLHIMAGLYNTFFQVLRALENDSIRIPYINNEIIILAGYYDIFSATLYLYKLKPNLEIYDIARTINTEILEIPNFFVEIK